MSEVKKKNTNQYLRIVMLGIVMLMSCGIAHAVNTNQVLIGKYFTDHITYDASPLGNNLNCSSSVSINTTVKRFGNISVMINAPGRYCSMPQNTYTRFNRSNITVNVWVYQYHTGNSGNPFSKDATPLSSATTKIFSESTSTTTSAMTIKSSSGTTHLGVSGTAWKVGKWNMITIVFENPGAANARLYYYINGTLQGSDTTPTDTYLNYAMPLMFGNRRSNINGFYFNGSIDDATVWNTSLTSAQISNLYNYNSIQTNFTVRAANYLNTTNKIMNLSVKIGSTTYSTSSGEIITNVSRNLLRTAIVSAPGFNSRTYTSYNTSRDLEGVLNISGSFVQTASYSGFVTYSGVDHVRNLSTSVTYLCLSNATTRILRFINKTYYDGTIVSCNNQTATLSGSFNVRKNAFFNISYIMNRSDRPVNISSASLSLVGLRRFKGDQSNPEIILANATVAQQFSIAQVSLKLQCRDKTYPSLRYTAVFNNAVVYSTNRTNNTISTNLTTLNDGSNTYVATCGDPFGNTSLSLTFTASSDTFWLIEESTGRNFQVRNLTSAKLFLEDNSTYYDFKASGNKSNVSFTTIGNRTKLRFELGYKDGTFITRYFDAAIMTSPVYVCANNQTIQHYEQFVISNTNDRYVKMKNLVFGCYIVGDYVRFAYQTGYFVRAWTTQSNYYLYTLLNGADGVLANIDGGRASDIDLDSIIFARREYDFNLFGRVFSVQKCTASTCGNSSFSVNFNNVANDSTRTSLSITRMDTDALMYSSSDYSNPNRFTVVVNYYGENITDETLFKAVLCVTTSEEDCQNHYFTLTSSPGLINSTFAAVIAIFILVFGLNLTATEEKWSWLGLVVCIIGLFVVGLAQSTWYIVFIRWIYVVVLLYIVANMVIKGDAVKVT